MPKVIIRVKKDRLNESIHEDDHEFVSFLELLNNYSLSIDTLNNFFIVINYEISVPVYLSALNVLKAHSNNDEIIGREIPLRSYVEGFNHGLQTDITPGINKIEFVIENIKTIFESKIPPFHFDNSYRYSKYPGGSTTNVIGFSDDLWFQYGVQIGKEKQAWNAILENQSLFEHFLDRKWNRNLVDVKKENQKSVKEYETVLQITPIFKSDNVDDIYNILKDFFSDEHQILLDRMLKTGEEPNEPLIFLDNGNRLADTFLKLKQEEVITGCNKKNLEFWICNNFKYIKKNQPESFKPKYLNSLISSKDGSCTNPIIFVKSDKITGKKTIIPG